MFAGFDYGTSHCSMAVMLDSQLRLAELDQGETLIQSNLWAPRVNLGLRRDEQERLDMDAQSFHDLRFGQAALDAYLAEPTEGYYVKSPKSFLGAPGLTDEVKERFVSIVAAMMGNVRQGTERSLGVTVDQVVIGRPVNFQGPSDKQENTQALDMLRAAARDAGFTDVEFLFEPMAAAMEYESRLSQEQKVLVVDVGGGTTDCSFVRVGPTRMNQSDRSQDILGHAGERLGGNDYDQALALHEVMPLFGWGAELLNGLPVPNNYLVDAVSINDVNAQQRFYSKATGERLDYFVRESVKPEQITRLRELRETKSSYRLLRAIEMGKIELSTAERALLQLAFIEAGLTVEVTQGGMEMASKRLCEHLVRLLDETLAQADTQPDVVYLTGGMSKATVVREAIRERFGDLPQVDSDHFGSVTQGLAIWAGRLFG